MDLLQEIYVVQDKYIILKRKRHLRGAEAKTDADKLPAKHTNENENIDG